MTNKAQNTFDKLYARVNNHGYSLTMEQFYTNEANLKNMEVAFNRRLAFVNSAFKSGVYTREDAMKAVNTLKLVKTTMNDLKDHFNRIR